MSHDHYRYAAAYLVCEPQNARPELTDCARRLCFTLIFMKEKEVMLECTVRAKQ